MNINQFKDQVVREAKANPGKAAALGGLMLYAIYAWAPLVMNWRGSASPSAEPATVKAADGGAPVATTTPTSASPASNPGENSWRGVKNRIELDPLMRPTGRAMRDPFAKKEVPVELPPPVEVVVAPVIVPQKITPGEIGLAVTTTIISKTSGIALISGTPYRTGDKIRRLHNGKKVEFIVETVADGSVTLTDGEAKFELNVPKPKLATDDDMP